MEMFMVLVLVDSNNPDWYNTSSRHVFIDYLSESQVWMMSEQDLVEIVQIAVADLNHEGHETGESSSESIKHCSYCLWFSTVLFLLLN